MRPRITPKIWELKYWDRAKGQRIADIFKIPLSIAALLLQRGLSDPEEIDKFLNPTLNHLPSPFFLKDIDVATEIVIEALVKKQPIAIYGDYDVDGITASAVLTLFLREIGLNPHCYQPDRLNDGYGLHEHLIKNINHNVSTDQEKVLITVDCGISNVEEVDYAKKLGFKVIVTDHHQPPNDLPAADAIVNPWQKGCSFPFKELAGVGVAFYLTMALRNRLSKMNFWEGRSVPNLKKYLDLVAIGTVCDMVPLLGPNRIFVKAGLEALQHTTKAGLQSLLQQCDLAGKTIGTDDIAYRIGPRINAPGRIGHCKPALDLLLETDADQARNLSLLLEKSNTNRKKQSEELFQFSNEAAVKAIEKGKNAIIITGNDWHPGLLGLVATKVANNFFRPTVVLSKINGLYKGSGRSIPGLNLYEIILECQKHLNKHGGHKNAVGIALEEKNILGFEQAFEASINNKIIDTMLIPKVMIDLELKNESGIGPAFFQHYERLEPFGIGNMEPIFSYNIKKIHKMRIVGEDHLKFTLEIKGKFYDGIGFNLGHVADEIAMADFESTRIAFSFRRNNYNGNEGWQANAADFSFSMP